MKRVLAAALLVTSPVIAQPAPREAGPATPSASPPGGTAEAPPVCQRSLGDGPPSAVCFDPGHRLHVGLGTDGVGLGVQLRTETRGDDPGTSRRSEHALLRTTAAYDRFRGTLYEGRFVRHSREGSLVLPGNPPRHIAVPFDVGLETTVGAVRGQRSSPRVRLGAVRAAVLLDLARSETFRRRLALGPVARWDVLLDRPQRAVREQAVAPFTAGTFSAYVESDSGLTLASLRLDAGYATLGRSGWRPLVLSELLVERIVLAANDHPLSLYALGRYERPGDGLRFEAGVRLALFGR